MKQLTAEEILEKFYKPPFWYDAESGGYVFDQNGNMIIEVRGFGHLCSKLDGQEAREVQDRLGYFIVEILNAAMTEYASQSSEKSAGVWVRREGDWDSLSFDIEKYPVIRFIATKEPLPYRPEQVSGFDDEYMYFKDGRPRVAIKEIEWLNESQPVTQSSELLEALKELVRCNPVFKEGNLIAEDVTLTEFLNAIARAKAAIQSYESKT
jgi:hypothetical protein